MTQFFTRYHGDLLIFLIIVIPLACVLMGVFFGEFVPTAIFFATAIVAVFLFPRIPGSPTACMIHHDDPCKGRLDWVAGTCILLPLVLAETYKMRRRSAR